MEDGERGEGREKRGWRGREGKKKLGGRARGEAGGEGFCALRRNVRKKGKRICRKNIYQGMRYNPEEKRHRRGQGHGRKE